VFFGFMFVCSLCAVGANTALTRLSWSTPHICTLHDIGSDDLLTVPISLPAVGATRRLAGIAAADSQARSSSAVAARIVMAQLQSGTVDSRYARSRAAQSNSWAAPIRSSRQGCQCLEPARRRGSAASGPLRSRAAAACPAHAYSPATRRRGRVRATPAPALRRFGPGLYSTYAVQFFRNGIAAPTMPA
jgi:hypothetical protein